MKYDLGRATFLYMLPMYLLSGCVIGLNVTVFDTGAIEVKEPNVDPSGGQTNGGQSGGQNGGQTNGGQSGGQSGGQNGGQNTSGSTTGGQTGNPPGVDTGNYGDTGNTEPLPATLIQNITPRFGPTTGNTLITITGGPYDAGTQVFFGPVQASIVYQTTNELQVLSPTAQNEGAVDIRVTTLSDSASYPLGFAYFLNATGDTGAIGFLRYYSLMGTYWEAGSTLNQGEAEIIFLNSPDLHLWELVVPALDTCSPTTYSYSGNVTLYNMQETQIQLQSSLGSQITLYWDTQLSLYKSSTLSQSALPNNTFYDLMPFTGNLQGFEVPSIAKTSQPASISNPALQGGSPPTISQYQQFNWTPSGASWIGITVAVNNNPLNGSYVDMINCMVVDDGDFTIQGNFFTQWIAGRQVDVFFSRYVEHEVILPHNNSIGRIAGEYVQLGAGIAQ